MLIDQSWVRAHFGRQYNVRNAPFGFWVLLFPKLDQAKYGERIPAGLFFSTHLSFKPLDFGFRLEWC